MSAVAIEALKEVRDRLADIGFRKRTGEIYTRPAGGDVLGWVGLPRAARPNGAASIIPTIGVHHPLVERLVHEFTETKKPGITATLARPLGYLFPDPGWRKWIFSPGENLAPFVDDMVDSISRYGVPYMEANVDLNAVAEKLEKISGPTLEGPKRLGIIHALQGDQKQALAALRPLFDQVDNWSTGRAESFKFLENFGSHFDIPVFGTP